MRCGAASNCRIARNVKVRMRDGVDLSTTVILPVKKGKYPAVLIRSAYNRVGSITDSYAKLGMALVVQDCRGRYDSGGDWWPFVNEPNDGVDTLEWILRQEWSDGKIGMQGASYLAATQFLSVKGGGAKMLHALNPQFMTNDCWRRAYYSDGAFSLGLTWSWLCFECSARTSEASSMPLFDVSNLLRELPIVSLDEKSGAGQVPFYRDYVSRYRYDKKWKYLSVNEYADFTMPVLLTAGWYDYYPAEAAEMFCELRSSARDASLRDSHRLLIGPWTHGFGSTSVLGELDFGPKALEENNSSSRWLECILKGKGPESFQKAPIRIFVMGKNEWRDEYEWPLKRTRFEKWYLHSGGNANSLHGDGALGRAAPKKEKPDCYNYDPENPVPTLGGNHSIGPYNPGLYELAKPGPFDQRPVEQRDDVLVYTSDALPEDLEATGPVTLKLFASSSAKDTDFVAKLVDVHPDGRAFNITEGVIRARFRSRRWDKPELMIPGKTYEFTIDMKVTSNVFMKGHRIRLDITSSSFPLWDRNLNTGNDPGTDTEMQIAEQTIFHDGKHRSHLLLPVIP